MLVVFRYHIEMRTGSSEQPPTRTLPLGCAEETSFSSSSQCCNYYNCSLAYHRLYEPIVVRTMVIG